MSVVSAIETQARVVWSITARENMRQHRSSPIGMLSSLLEPIALIMMMTLVFAYIRLRVPGMGDYLMLFLMTGVVPIYMFRKGVNSAERVAAQMRPLLFFRTVRPLDLMLGGLLNAFLALIALFCLMTLFFKLVYRVPEPENFVLSLVPTVCNAGIAFGFASVNLLIKTWFPYWGTIFTIITAPLGICSGLFYTAEVMPERVRDILYYNPIFHSTDWTRHFFYPDYTSEFFDPYYYFGWVFGSLVVGLTVERYFRYRLVSVTRR